MKIDLVIDALRQRCPTLAGRVAGAAQFVRLQENQQLPVPCAFVVPQEDNAEPNRSSNGYRQPIEDTFSVIVGLDNTVDERGQSAVTSIHDIRAELWKALLGWQPEADYNGIEYDGGSVADVDRARLWYRFDFTAAFEIGSDDIGNPETWQALELAAAPDLTSVKFTLDAIDPYDPNTGSTGPDGKPEAVAVVDLPTT